MPPCEGVEGTHPAEDSPWPAHARWSSQAWKTRLPALDFPGCGHVLDTLQSRGEWCLFHPAASPSDFFVMEV